MVDIAEVGLSHNTSREKFLIFWQWALNGILVCKLERKARSSVFDSGFRLNFLSSNINGKSNVNSVFYNVFLGLLNVCIFLLVNKFLPFQLGNMNNQAGRIVLF